MEAIAIATRDAIEVVKPRAVIAGHKKPENDDNQEPSRVAVSGDAPISRPRFTAPVAVDRSF